VQFSLVSAYLCCSSLWNMGGAIGGGGGPSSSVAAGARLEANFCSGVGGRVGCGR
jgi:hypothetical protein